MRKMLGIVIVLVAVLVFSTELPRDGPDNSVGIEHTYIMSMDAPHDIGTIVTLAAEQLANEHFVTANPPRAG